jgi:uncharacterized protein YbjT (DUF2867 family)
MKIVVIGGTGLIGTKVVKNLRERGHEAKPLNGVVDLAGPEPIGMDELVRRFLRAKNDARQVITDAAAGYFGTPVNDQSLVPVGPSRLGKTRFEDWLSQGVPQV